VYVKDIHHDGIFRDKDGIRVFGDLIIDGEYLSTSLIGRNYAFLYNGYGKKKDWR